MSGPERLNRSSGLAGELLLSAKADKAPADASRRLLAGAAVGAALAAKSGAVGSLAGSVGSGHAARWTAWKWVVIGLAGVGSVGAAKVVLTSREDARSHVQAAAGAAARGDVAGSAPVRASSSPGAARAPSVVPVLAPTWVAPSAPVFAAAPPPAPARAPVAAAPPSVRMVRLPAPAPAPAPEVAPTVAPAPASPMSHLALEIAAIDGAKRTLAGGDATSVLERMNAYDTAFPQGMLAAEANALRIEALVRLGRREDAKAELARFRTRHPGSPLLESLTRVVGE